MGSSATSCSSSSAEQRADERPRVVVVDHHDSYTYNLVHLVASVTGDLPPVVEHDEVSPVELLGGEYTHVVLSPGPGHPDVVADFAVGRAVLEQARIPVLGVCLGMQGLVTAYGGKVDRVDPAHGEVTLVEHDDALLFSGVPRRFEAVRYHSLAAVDVPAALRVTARGGGVVMAVEHRSRPLHGVQFHPESVLTRYGTRLVANFLRIRP